MMQTAKPWHRYNLETCTGNVFRLTVARRSLRQRKVRADLVVIADVFIQEPLEMTFIQDDQMVEQLSTATPNPSFCDAILPGAPETSSLGLDSEALYCVDHFLIETRPAIKYQLFGRGLKRERLAQLLNRPGARRMFGHIVVENAPPVMRDDKEAVEHSEDQGGHGEEVYDSDGLTIVAQKCRPLLCRLRAPWCFSHPPQCSSFRNIEAKHFQFTMDAWRTPGWVPSDHSKDHLA